MRQINVTLPSCIFHSWLPGCHSSFPPPAANFQLPDSILQDQAVTTANRPVKPVELLHQSCTLWKCVSLPLSPAARIWMPKSEKWCLTALCRSPWWYSPSSAPTFSLTYSVSTDLSNKRSDRRVPLRREATTSAQNIFQLFINQLTEGREGEILAWWAFKLSVGPESKNKGHHQAFLSL